MILEGQPFFWFGKLVAGSHGRAKTSASSVEPLLLSRGPKCGRRSALLRSVCQVRNSFSDVSFYVSAMAIFKANCKPSKRVWENPMDVGYPPKGVW